MGLLDEAIRDHLDLKRRHGADPGEVARLENEALGPDTREGQEEPESASYEELAAPHDVHIDDEVHQPLERETALWSVVEPEPELHAEPQPPVEPPATDTLGATQPLAPVDLDQPTQQFTVPDVEADESTAEPELEPYADEELEPEIVAADEEPHPEDVLEETPEFLQETPEHDRLWFEQKPPRDFDF